MYLRLHRFSSRSSDIKPLRWITPKDYIWKGTIKGFRVNYNEPCSDTTARYYIEMTSGWDGVGSWVVTPGDAAGDKRKRRRTRAARLATLLTSTAHQKNRIIQWTKRSI